MYKRYKCHGKTRKMSCRHYFLKSSVLMSLITENTGCASYKTKLQNVEDTSNSWENRRYEFSPALSAKKSSHFTRNGQKFSCVIHGSNFQNVLRTLKSSWKRRYHLSLVPPGKFTLRRTRLKLAECTKDTKIIVNQEV